MNKTVLIAIFTFPFLGIICCPFPTHSARNCSHTFRNRSPLLHVTQEHPSWLSDCAGPVYWVPQVLHSNGSSIVVPFQSGDTCGCSGWGPSSGSYSYKCMLYHVVASVNSQPHSNHAGFQSVKNYEGNLRS